MEEKDNITTAESTPETPEEASPSSLALSPTHITIIALLVVILIMAGFLVSDDEDLEVETTAMATSASSPSAESPAEPAQESVANSTEPSSATTAIPESGGGIERKGEGRLFYRTITIPANAETLYLSGSGASQKPDGTWGNMEEQAIDTFTKFKATLEEEGWSMADIVQVRAFAVAGDYGLLDFDGFNRGYSRFFGTQENPNKPVRSFVQVADLVVDGWLVEIEIRAARVP